jgi:hypothetical protein
VGFRKKNLASSLILICVGMCSVAFAIGFMLPTVAKVRDPVAKMQSSNQLKQLLLATHSFSDKYGYLPRQAIYSEDGKPLLSWRVAILPYIEEEKLYTEFHLDEPWDSPHNIKLLQKMPLTLAHPKSKRETNEKGLTHYQAFVSRHGPEAARQLGLFHTVIVADPDAKVRLKEINEGDGLGQTFFIAEAKAPVPWTAPMDLSDTSKVSDLGGLLDGGFYIVLGDGRAHFFYTGELTDQLLLEGIRANDGKGPFLPE